MLPRTGPQLRSLARCPTPVPPTLDHVNPAPALPALPQGHLKTVIILAGGCLLFGDTMPPKKLAGVGAAMAGIVWCAAPLAVRREGAGAPAHAAAAVGASWERPPRRGSLGPFSAARAPRAAPPGPARRCAAALTPPQIVIRLLPGTPTCS
jgi:hypothetical protein